MEKALGSRHGHQGAHLSATAALTKDGHIGRVTAKVGDILLDPFQGLDNIQHTHITGVGVLGAVAAQIQETQGIEPVVEGNHHHAVVTGQVGAVVAGLLLRGALAEAAAVQPHHHGKLAARLDAGSPYIHAEAVLAGIAVVPMHGEGLVVVSPAGAVGMGTHRAVRTAGPHLFPRFRVCRGHKALGLAVRDTFINVHAIVHITGHGTGYGLDGRSLCGSLKTGSTLGRIPLDGLSTGDHQKSGCHKG